MNATKAFFVIIAIVFSAQIYSEDYFPQNVYLFNRYMDEFRFDHDGRFQSNIILNDNQLTSIPFISNIQGTFHVKIINPFTYINVIENNGAVFLFVAHWINDTLILTNVETKESINLSGTDYYKPPVSLTPQLRYFVHYEATSHLTEEYGGRRYTYSAENLKDFDLTTPWVEGKPGSGIGERIIFSSSDSTRAVGIVNGYFDPQRPELFYANNRIKSLTLRAFSIQDEAKTYEVTWDIADNSNFQFIVLKEPYKKFEIEIKEIYLGDKYDDTCISGIFTHVGLGYYKPEDNKKYPEIILPMEINPEYISKE